MVVVETIMTVTINFQAWTHWLTAITMNLTRDTLIDGSDRGTELTVITALVVVEVAMIMVVAVDDGDGGGGGGGNNDRGSGC